MARTAALSVVVAVALATVFAPSAQSRAAAGPDESATLPCVAFNPDLGEYGAYVFRPLHKPARCTEYVGNRPCHCTEAPLTGIHWRHWGSNHAAGVGYWHYCGSGVCTWRRAHLLAYRIDRRCGPTYTRLRMRLPRHRLHGHLQPVYRAVFRLPACGGPFEYIST
ncbi:MAG TPA: hypothetical protein VMT37_08470 [Solirubrobacterales bacterium]|nr:hypothetical protein [Solirubrobacterales bacterium]